MFHDVAVASVPGCGAGPDSGQASNVRDTCPKGGGQLNPAKDPVRFPLHITIGTLFVGIVVLLGAVLAFQAYSQSRDMILSSAEELHGRIGREIQLSFAATYRPVVGSLRLLALSPLASAETRERRLESLSLLTTALSEVEAVSGIQFGYPNGDYFIVRPLRDAQAKAQFSAPRQAAYVMDDISDDGGVGRRLHRVYFDAGLDPIERNAPVSSDYDPRSRPWYLEAGREPVAVQPYLFHFVREVGTTVAIKTPQAGVVVASDVSLDQLSHTISQFRITPDSEAAIVHADGRMLAYHDAAKVVVRKGDGAFSLTRIGELGSGVLSDFGRQLDVTPRRLDFEYRGRHWTGSIEPIARNSGLGMNVLLLSPVDELLEDAVAIGRESVFSVLVVILISIPLVWLVSTRIAGPIRRLAQEVDKIRQFDFAAPVQTRSAISEVDDLAEATRMMKGTINQFLALINSLAGEKVFDVLLEKTTRETMQITQADAAVAYLIDDDETRLCAETLQTAGERSASADRLPDIELTSGHPLIAHLYADAPGLVSEAEAAGDILASLSEALGDGYREIVTVPLRNRQDESVGMLVLLFHGDAHEAGEGDRPARLAFANALSGFAAVSIESRHLFEMQADLLEAFIKLIAGAIDSKSPYTGGHCQRVPELTRMLAEAACASNAPPFADFDLGVEDWEALHIASWLHDCGKVTTPEYVVDKSTKLETLYDRIHEIRMRFEVLKRDVEIRYWEQLADGGDADSLAAERDAALARLDDDFAFVAECNEGGEFMAPERLERLRSIAQRTWMRTLDDRMGISWEERRRKERAEALDLPVVERLIDDKPEHLIERPEGERIPDDNPWGFRLDVPEYQYNRGELYNLGVARGTLSPEERFKINDHVVQTIVMLDKLPYPKHLRQVPEIAGGHHETLDGRGYPRRLTRDETSLAARMMAIADIFEALTASDRPYKKAKTLSESIRILKRMKDDAHIDPDLFRLFLESGVWKDYAGRFLDPAQIDEVHIDQYLD